MSAPIGRPAQAQDRDAILETLDCAFARDPVWGAWAFPDLARAPDQRRAMFGFWLAGALRLGAVRVTQNCEAVAVWYPPDGWIDTAAELSELAHLAVDLLGDHAGTFLAGCALLEKNHPRAPHYYLSLLGVHDRQRGKGIGQALLAENMAHIESLGLPVYLESTNRVNAGFYRSFGFECIGVIDLPAAGPTIELLSNDPGLSAR